MIIYDLLLFQDFTLVNPLQTNSLRKKSKKKNDNVEKEVKYNTDQLTCETCQKSYSSHRYLEVSKSFLHFILIALLSSKGIRLDLQ